MAQRKNNSFEAEVKSDSRTADELPPVEPVESRIASPKAEVQNKSAMPSPETTQQPSEYAQQELAYRKTRQEAYDKAHDARQGQADSIEDIISKLEEESEKAKRDDETARRKERNRLLVAGIADGLSGLANLIGVGAFNASNQKMAFNAPEIAKMADAARKERRGRMDDIRKRQDEQWEDLMKARLQLGLGDAEAAAAIAKDNADRDEKARQRQLEQERYDDMLARKDEEAEFTREQFEHRKDMDKKGLGLKGEMLQGQKENDAALRRAAEDKARADVFNRKYGDLTTISYMPDGGTAEETFEIGQKTLEANLRSSIDDIRDDIARKAGFKDGFRGYKAAGKKTLKKLPEEIRDALMALDGLYGEDGKANLSTAERYFRQSPTVMARLKTAAKRDHDAVYGATGGKTTETGASQGGGTSWEDDFFGITRTN